MPKRSSRSKIIKGSSSSNYEVKTDTSGNSSTLPSSLESYFAPKEMKKRIADALKETPNSPASVLESKNDKNNNNGKKREKKNAKNKKNVNVFRLQFGGDKDSLIKCDGDKNSSKMVYSDVVRNSILSKMSLCDLSLKPDEDSSDSMATSKDSNSSGSLWSSTSDSNSLKDSCENSLQEPSKETYNIRPKQSSDTELDNSNSSLTTMLAKLTPEALQELELDEATWEVVSTGEWSHCGSDLISEDQFQVVNDDDDNSSNIDNDRSTRDVLSPANNQSTKQHATNSILTNKESDSIEEKENTNTNSSNQIKEAIPGAPTEAQLQQMKKKVIVSRKYIGGPDFSEKMKTMNFEYKGNPEDGHQLYAGVYKSAKFTLEASQRCGLLVVSVRAQCDSILTGLTCLQSLIEVTGLCSYGNAILPNKPK